LRTQGEEGLAAIARLLTGFAFFAGIGYKTTMGMGQAAPMHHERLAKEGAAFPNQLE